MTDTNETQVEVTQADREAAADLIEWHNTAASEWHIEGGADLRFFASDMPEGTRKGIWDEHEFVQAFARHRIEAEKRTAPRSVVEALEKSIEGWDNVVEFGLLPRQHRPTANELSERCSTALASLTTDDALVEELKAKLVGTTAGAWEVENPMDHELWIVEAGKETYEWRTIAGLPYPSERGEIPRKQVEANAEFIAWEKTNAARILRALEGEG